MPKTSTEETLSDTAVRRWPWKTTIPLVVFLVIVIFLAIGLTLDPRKVPSPLIGKPVPDFRLPAVLGRTEGLATQDLKGEESLLNV